MYPTFPCVIHLPNGPLHHLGLGGGLHWDDSVEPLSLEPFPLTQHPTVRVDIAFSLVFPSMLSALSIMELILLKHHVSHLGPLVSHLEGIWICPTHPSLPCSEFS